MENERSKSALQDYPAEYLNHKHTTKYESNSNGLLIREIAKRSKKASTQNTTPQATNISDFSAFLGAVNRCYSERKQSMLKRFKECSLSPCSDEYRSVLQGFQGVDEEPVLRSIVAEPKRSKNRKISFNVYGRGSKYSCKKKTSRFNNDLVPSGLSPRPRVNTLPSRLSEGTTPEIQLQGGKAKATDKDLLDVLFRSNVKLAWHGLNEDVNFSAKKERRRHVSLSEPAQRIDFGRKGEETKEKLSKTSSQREFIQRTILSQKERQRKKAEIDLPKIEKRVFIDSLQSLQIKRSGAEISNETQRKIYTADQMNARHGFKKTATKDLSRGENCSDRQRSYSGGHLSYDSKGTVRMKTKLCHSYSSPGTGQSKTSEISLAPLLDLRNNNNAEFSEKLSTIRQTDEFARTRASLRRVGKATLAATRRLKIHYRENGLKKAVAITDDGKELMNCLRR